MCIEVFAKQEVEKEVEKCKLQMKDLKLAAKNTINNIREEANAKYLTITVSYDSNKSRVLISYDV